MSQIATRIATGLAAAGVATLMTVAPAQASVTDSQGSGCSGTVCTWSGPNTAASGTTPWLQIILGAAGGVALAGAGAASISSRKRNQHHNRLTPAA